MRKDILPTEARDAYLHDLEYVRVPNASRELALFTDTMQEIVRSYGDKYGLSRYALARDSDNPLGNYTDSLDEINDLVQFCKTIVGTEPRGKVFPIMRLDPQNDSPGKWPGDNDELQSVSGLSRPFLEAQNHLLDAYFESPVMFYTCDIDARIMIYNMSNALNQVLHLPDDDPLKEQVASNVIEKINRLIGNPEGYNQGRLIKSLSDWYKGSAPISTNETLFAVVSHIQAARKLLIEFTSSVKTRRPVRITISRENGRGQTSY